MRLPFSLAYVALIAACSASPGTQPSVDASVDAFTQSVLDATADTPAAPVDAVDAASVNGSTAILGTLRGTCGTVRGMLRSAAPSLLRNELSFMAPEMYVRGSLSPHGQRLFDSPNAGGSSIESEVMSVEVLHYCEGATLLRTETEVRYAPPDDSGPNSITDALVTIDGMRVGVSVTRAYRPRPMVLGDMDVRSLLETKLAGINRSSMRVLPEDRWVKQILHVFVVDDAVAAQVERAWNSISPALRADTIVIVTVTRGGGFIYCNPDPALGMECPAIGG